jgi:hypothetical protein
MLGPRIKLTLDAALLGLEAQSVIGTRLSQIAMGQGTLAEAKCLGFDVLVCALHISLQEALNSLRKRGSLMAHVAKKANQDGTFTVYGEDRPVGLGLTGSGAGTLIHRMLTR